MSVTSPLTGKNNCSPVEVFLSAQIIREYEKRGIQVSHFFKGVEKVILYECHDSGYRFFYPDTLFGDDQFYQELYKNIPDYYHPNRWEHKKALQIIPTNGSLLEVGCGDGIFLLKTLSKVKNALGLELNTKAVETATAKGLQVVKQTVQEHAALVESHYDVVCCFQVLEHIYDVKSFLQAMIDCTKPGGLLLIGVPNNHPYLFGTIRDEYLNLPPHHSGWWNKESLTNLAHIFPMKLVEIYNEPLDAPKVWYQGQIRKQENSKSIAATLLKAIPRPIYKTVLQLSKNFIKGQTIMAVYRKNEL